MEKVWNVGEIAQEFEAAPLEARRHIEQWKSENYQQFLYESGRYLRQAGESNFSRTLLCQIRDDGHSLEKLLLSGNFLELPEAQRVLRMVARMDPAYPQTLLERLRVEAEAEGSQPNETATGIARVAKVARLMDLVNQSVDLGAVAPVVERLAKHPDARIRSKAVLLRHKIARQLRQNVDFIPDQDPRVRANAVEALWGEKDEHAQAVFLEALDDPHHRVVANGLWGLYQAGNLVSIRKIPAMLRHAETPWHLAGLWLIAKTGDYRFQALLENLLPQATGKLRSGILRAARIIEERRRKLAEFPALEMKLLAAQWGAGGRFQCRFRLLDSQARELSLHPPAILIQDGAGTDRAIRVDAFRFLSFEAKEPAYVALVYPHRPGVDDPRALAQEAALERARKTKRPQDRWAVLPYSLDWGEPTCDAHGHALPFVTNPEPAWRHAAEVRSGARVALADAARGFPAEAKNRHIIFLRDEKLSSMLPDVARWLAMSGPHQLTLHVLAGKGCPTAEFDLWRTMAEAGRTADTGAGLAVQEYLSDRLLQVFADWIPAVASHSVLSYGLHRLGEGSGVNPKPVLVEAYTEQGLGRLEVVPH
ncbi:MAG: hypothetical protein NW208_11830 [Bryobacter sp.]|nr:hypothetical protein [Bryobacter sp.]